MCNVDFSFLIQLRLMVDLRKEKIAAGCPKGIDDRSHRGLVASTYFHKLTERGWTTHCIGDGGTAGQRTKYRLSRQRAIGTKLLENFVRVPIERPVQPADCFVLS